MASQNEIVRSIADEIERHFAVHPTAADSAEGIRDWWLPPAFHLEPLSAIVSALEELEMRGMVSKTELKGIGAIYSKAASHRGSLH